MNKMTDEELVKMLNKCEELVKYIDPLLKPKAFEICFNILFGNLTSIYNNTQVRKESSQQSTLLSLPELIKRSKAKIHTNKIMVIAYYLFYMKKMDEFNVNHIKESLQNARQPLPGNTNNLLNGLINKGYLMKAPSDVDGLKGFRITQSGIDEVEKILTQKA